MNVPILILIGSQLVFTVGDLMARSQLSRHGFLQSTFMAPWFVAYLFLRTIATIGQLYVFSRVDLGKTMAFFGAVSIVAASVLGYLVLHEVLTPWSYLGIMLAVLAFFMLALR